jgi:hypothetical protein
MLGRRGNFETLRIKRILELSSGIARRHSKAGATELWVIERGSSAPILAFQGGIRQIVTEVFEWACIIVRLAFQFRMACNGFGSAAMRTMTNCLANGQSRQQHKVC